jgi:hypothetical protein
MYRPSGAAFDAARLTVFPVATVVLPVGQDMPNKNAFGVEVNRRDQAVFIAAYVEHVQIANLIDSWEVSTHLGEVPPLGVLGDIIPILQRRLRIGMLVPEFPKDRLAEDAQRLAPVGSRASTE